jgi:membrane fusion protein (multidrug efflux system)
VQLRFGDGSVYPHLGCIAVATQRVDALTGTIEARAIFRNPDSMGQGSGILPGQFVRIAVRGVTLPNAIVVPEPAVMQSPQGPAVYVIGADNKAEARPVQLGQRVGGGIVVTSGLGDGDRVVVDGIIRVRPGNPVRPAPASGPAQQQAGNGAASENPSAPPDHECKAQEEARR